MEDALGLRGPWAFCYVTTWNGFSCAWHKENVCSPLGDEGCEALARVLWQEGFAASTCFCYPTSPLASRPVPSSFLRGSFTLWNIYISYFMRVAAHRCEYGEPGLKAKPRRKYSAAVFTALRMDLLQWGRWRCWITKVCSAPGSLLCWLHGTKDHTRHGQF